MAEHMLASLVAAAALFLVYFTLLTYLLGTRRIVRQSQSSGTTLETSYNGVTTRTFVWLGVGAVPLSLLFYSGLPTASVVWTPQVHHGLFWVTIVLQILVVGRLMTLVGQSEKILLEVGAGEYNDASS